MKTKEKGDIAVGKAISFYLSQIKEVLLPIGDKQKYDLVVDDSGKFIKIQCKYTSTKGRNKKHFDVSLRQTGGNQSFHTAKKYSKDDFDILFVVTSDNDVYEIPFDVIKSTSSCLLNERFLIYKK